MEGKSTTNEIMIRKNLDIEQMFEQLGRIQEEQRRTQEEQRRTQEEQKRTLEEQRRTQEEQCQEIDTLKQVCIVCVGMVYPQCSKEV